jgi:hypothetical protein
MSHRKGFTNNPNGRPQGSQNKTTKEIRSMLHAFVEKNIEGIQNDFDQLESIERLRVLEKFIQYLIPRFASVQEIETEIEEIKPLIIILTKSEAEEMDLND